MSPIAEKLAEIRQQYGLNRSKFAEKIGISSQLYGKYEDGKIAPKMDFYKKLKQFTGVDLLQEETNVSPEKIDLSQTIIRKEKKVPLFDAQASAGNEYAMDLAPVTNPSNYIALGDLLSSDSQAAMYVFGNSMNPAYPSGCIIGLRQNLDGIIQPGSVYVIETDSNRYFKRLYYNDDKTAYTCISDNSLTFETGPRKGKFFYEPFDIPFEKVRRLFDVTGMVKRNLNSAIMSKAS